MLYTAYGLAIESELTLPELGLARIDTAQTPDVSVRIGPVPTHGLPNGQQRGAFLSINRESLWIHVPRIARFLVQNGQTITIDPEPGIDEDSIRLFLLGSAFGALLFQRGHLVLHGNAIRIGDACMVCVGQSGAGKSTLAAGFWQRGHQVLADDVVAVNAAYHALPGFPRIKLWQDAATNLAIDTTQLHRIRPQAEKFHCPVESTDAISLPIRWIYILNNDHVDDVQIMPIRGMQRFQPLHDNTYRVHYLNGMTLKPEHLGLCGRLAGRIHLARLTRPRDGFSLNAMIDVILADVAAHP